MKTFFFVVFLRFWWTATKILYALAFHHDMTVGATIRVGEAFDEFIAEIGRVERSLTELEA
jgi:hypothetical protein